jgi:tetratricopeptide (TPR) repeat protein
MDTISLLLKMSELPEDIQRYNVCLCKDKGKELEKTLEEVEGALKGLEKSKKVKKLKEIWKKRVSEKECGKEEYLEAEKIFKKFIDIEPNKDFAEAYHKLGNVYYGLKFYEEAKENYEEALKKEWEDKDDKAWCYHDLGYLLYGAGKHKEAVKNYEEAIKIAEKAWFYNDLGAALMKLEKYEEALKAFDRALMLSEIDKDRAYVNNGLGRLYYRKGLYKNAREKLELAKKQNPELDEVYNNLGLLDLKEGLYGNAKKNFQEAINLDKNRKKECENLSEAHLNLGSVFFSEGKYEEAEDEYEYAIKIDRDFAEAYYSLGNVCVKKWEKEGKKEDKEKERAERLFKKALRIKPDYTEAREALDSLKEKKEGDWWDWWFSRSRQSRWKICKKISGRKIVGGLLIFFLIGIIVFLMALIVLGEKIGIAKIEKVIISNLTQNLTGNVTQTFSNITTTTTSPITIWPLIGLAALIFIILIFPQLKKVAVGVGGFKFEVETKDAGTGRIS